MFTPDIADVAQILRDYGIECSVESVIELQRYYYERDDPTSKEVRLIVKVNLCDGNSVVVRFKNEADVTLDLLNEQSMFAELLRKNEIATPIVYKANSDFAKWCIC